MESFIGLVGSLKPNQKITIVALDHQTGNTGSVEAMVR